MGTIDSILRLQEQYLDLVKQIRVAEAEYGAYIGRYGTGEQRKARLEQLKTQASERVIIKSSEHPEEFDSQHNLRTEGRARRWALVPGCSSCDRIDAEHGLNALQSEMDEIRRHNEEARELYGRVRDLTAQHEVVAQQHTQLEGLLPSNYLRLDGRGRITGTGPTYNFEIQGRRILEYGVYVDYDVDGRTARAVLDSSEQLVAYHLGDGSWTITATWEKYKSSLDRDTGLAQADIFVGTIGETDQKKKVHIAVNELGDIIFVRDMDGTVLYDRKNGKGYLPPDLDWSRENHCPEP